MGTLAGAMIAIRYFLPAVVGLYLAYAAVAIHLIYTVSKDAPNAPTYTDILYYNSIGIGLMVLVQIVAVISSSKIKSRLWSE